MFSARFIKRNHALLLLLVFGMLIYTTNSNSSEKSIFHGRESLSFRWSTAMKLKDNYKREYSASRGRSKSSPALLETGTRTHSKQKLLSLKWAEAAHKGVDWLRRKSSRFWPEEKKKRKCIFEWPNEQYNILKNFEPLIPIPGQNFWKFSRFMNQNLPLVKNCFDQCDKDLTGLVKLKGTDRDLYHLFKSGSTNSVRYAKDLSPLKNVISAIASIATAHNALRMLAHLHSIGVWCGFRIDAVKSDQDSGIGTLSVLPDGLGMPRGYYAKHEQEQKDPSYLQHIKKVWEMAGTLLGVEYESPSAASIRQSQTRPDEAVATKIQELFQTSQAEKIYKFEAYLAAHMNVPERGDGNFEMSVECGHLMDYYLEKIRVGKENLPLVQNPEYFEEFLKVFQDPNQIATLKSYFAWRLIQVYSPFLTKELDEADFEYFAKYVGGEDERLPLETRVIREVGEALPVPLGKMYVENRYFSKAKVKCGEMVDLLRKAFQQRLDTLDWMDAATKQKAHQRLQDLRIKIGFPDQWKEFPKANINQQNLYISNQLLAAKARFHYQVTQVGQKIDHDMWAIETFSHSIGVGDDFLEVPATFLKAPFFDLPTQQLSEDDIARNFGGLGTMIAHTMILKIIPKHVKCASKACAIRSNIMADVGALRLAYDALLLYREAHRSGGNGGDEAHECHQRHWRHHFFLSWALVNDWTGVDPTDAVDADADVNAASNRVNNAVKHMPEFIDTFCVRSHERMYLAKQKQCNLWAPQPLEEDAYFDTHESFSEEYFDAVSESE